MSWLKEFKEFAMKGNVVDLAVAVVIGAAFGKIISSLVADIFMPLLGLLTGGVDFAKLAITLRAASVDPKVPALFLNYGKFIQASIDFIIIAFAVFLLVKALSNLQRKKEAAPAPPSAQETLLTEIRDLLKADRKA